jgi:phosphate transport system substrate-binding protein
MGENSPSFPIFCNHGQRWNTGMPRRTFRLALLAAALAACSAGQAQSVDFSGLPSYAPAVARVHGVIRIHDCEIYQDLVHLWMDGFLHRQDVIKYTEYTVPAWFSGLCADTMDIGVAGRGIYLTEIKSFEATHGYPPLEIKFATGSFDKKTGATPGVIFFVNRDNPLRHLTLEQLDGIVGAQRTGGWVGSKWSTACARGPEKNIRTWGQLGLGGEWADRPIEIYGIDATLSGWAVLMQREVLHGGDKWNPAIHEIVRGGSEVPADARIVASVAQNRYALGFSFMRVVEKNPGVKALALESKPGGEFVAPTAESFYRRTYPLCNALYLYVNRPPGQPLRPDLKEFITYILSREGQQAVAEEGKFIPLNPDAAREELRKIQ